MAAKKQSSKSEFNFQPINERTVVRPFEAKEKTTGGIIIPEAAKDKPIAGKVMASDADGIEAGMTVVYGKYAGTIISINGEELVILKKEDILGIYLN